MDFSHCQCGNSLPQTPLKCAACETVPFCLPCSISADLLLCAKCLADQTSAADALDHKACEGCGARVPNIHLCDQSGCRKALCKACFFAPAKHRCVQCQCCRVEAWTEECCRAMKMCASCMTRHRSSFCETFNFYVCSGCKGKVLKFGDVTFACLVPGCAQQFCCTQCGVLKGGLEHVCYEHRSTMLCSGCLVPFALHKNGIVKLKYCIPRFTLKRQYCADCYRALKVVMLSMWRFVKAHKWHVPPQLMEGILVMVMNGMKHK